MSDPKQTPDDEQKVISNSYEELQSQGEDLGYQLTPESVNTQPTPADLLQGAAAYAQAAIGAEAEVRNFRQVSAEPEIWQAEVANDRQSGVLVAKRVPGGFKFEVESPKTTGV
jgi:hypothetical protein